MLIKLSLDTQDYYMTMLGPNSIKRAIEEAEKLSESLKLRLNLFCNIGLMQKAKVKPLCLTFFSLFRYEEVEVRKKLEEKERQEEKKRNEEITEKESRRSSPKTANKKDVKKVDQSICPI